MDAKSKSEALKSTGLERLLACLPTFRIFRAARLLKQFGLETMLTEVRDNRAGSCPRVN